MSPKGSLESCFSDGAVRSGLILHSWLFSVAEAPSSLAPRHFLLFSHLILSKSSCKASVPALSDLKVAGVTPITCQHLTRHSWTGPWKRVLRASEAKFKHILFENSGWGFVGVEDEDSEIHVERTLNVVGSGAQHATLFKDLMLWAQRSDRLFLELRRHIDVVFGGEDFETQPCYVVDTGSGDGHLLMQIYQHIKEHTSRGRHLEEPSE